MHQFLQETARFVTDLRRTSHQLENERPYRRPSYAFFFLIATLLFLVAACASETPGDPTATPTSELVVVVFETEEPTATPDVTEPTATPTVEATVGVGAVSSTESEDDSVQSTTTIISETSGGNTTFANRPPDVNPLTGLKVDDVSSIQRRPIMVRVGNDPGARPQVGLNQADIVYEEVVEWWVTRFTAVYLSQQPDIVAPIRSARLINLQLVPQYGGVLGNSGGSDGVRWEISQSDIINLDEFFIPGPYFYRENEGCQTRLALNVSDARDYLQTEGLEQDVSLRGFVFDEAPNFDAMPAEAVGDATITTIPYPQQTSTATWEYDPTTGKYLRATSGTPMLDFDGNRIAATNVIVYFADHQDTDIVEDSNGATSVRINVNGLGTAWVLRDGRIMKGNWESDGRQTPNFIFNDGQAMPLKPGNTWIEVVPLSYVIDIDGVDHPRESTAAGQSGASSSTEPEATTESATVEPSPTLTPIGARPAETEEPTGEATTEATSEATPEATTEPTTEATAEPTTEADN